MSYVDGFVLPVSERNLAAYRRMAELGRQDLDGARRAAYHECVADDVKPGKITSFPQA